MQIFKHDNANQNLPCFSAMLMTTLLLLAMAISSVVGWTPPSASWRASSDNVRPAFSSPEATTHDRAFVAGDDAIATRRRDFLTWSTTAAIVLATTAASSWPRIAQASYIDPVTEPPVITKRVWLDVEASGNGSGKGIGAFKGRLVIGLYGNLMPKVVDNFVRLCQDNTYAGTTFYRVVSDFSIQGGAIGDPTGKTGKTAAAILSSSPSSSSSTTDSAAALLPDNYNLKHTQAGLISMVNGPGGTVDSRFYINTNDNGGWGDDRYAAFGRLLDDESMELVKKIERVKVKPPKNGPIDEIRITASGVL